MPSAHLSIGAYGASVTRLHDFLGRQGFKVPPSEVDHAFFGPATRQAVQQFQQQKGLPVSGEVDQRTVAAIGIGASQRNAVESSAASQLGPSDESGMGMPVSAQAPSRAPASAHVPEGSQPADTSAQVTYQVSGRVASRTSASVRGLQILIVDKGVGDEARLAYAKAGLEAGRKPIFPSDVILAQATTDDQGGYTASFSTEAVRKLGKSQPDLQAQVVVGDNALLGASDVRYNASTREALDVVLDDAATSALRSEHEALTLALFEHFKGSLRDLKESDTQQDVTYLANKTGWDARAVALAALADHFSASTAGMPDRPGVGDVAAAAAGEAAPIPPQFFYALFRAGLPANADTLYQADARTVESIWKQAVTQGVIPKESADQIPALVTRFRALSAQRMLTGPALIGPSSLKDMLTVSGLPDEQHAGFARIEVAHLGDTDVLWKAATDAFGEAATTRLQVDGKLGFLTANNAPLMRTLHAAAGEGGLSDTLQLAQMGLYSAKAWDGVLTADIPLPKEIPGDTPEAQRANYAAYLAAQVRLSYPTAAVAHMVKVEALRLDDKIQSDSGQVHTFLTENQGKFEIGLQPVRQYISQNQIQLDDPTIRQVERIQRLYQLTPSDQAMIGLASQRVHSAMSIVQYGRETFVQTFAEHVGGAEQAALIYDRSVQVHGSVLNIALSWLHARTAPAIGVHSPAKFVSPAPVIDNTKDVIAYATLEQLFGSMDFCACDHCRSILSPAAYLVDLLQFLKPDDQDSPFSVLMSRRPDIQYLPLTCENTNTALPYIDVVNETLEYFVANSTKPLTLNDYKGNDTNGFASEDLLASPQFVMDQAYETLKNEHFPAPLPFHRPLENLRRYFSKFEVPLTLAMERLLRKPEDLERGANPYGWRDILMEEVGLSRAEHEILTESNTVSFGQMYGFPKDMADADVITGLSNAKEFARRIDISYIDLLALLQTRFVNPNLELIRKLEHLGMPFDTLKALKDGTLSDADFDKILANLKPPPNPAEYGGKDITDIKAWVKDDANYNRIMGLVTLTISTSPWKKGQHVEGACVLPTAPPAGSTLYYACTVAGISGEAEPTKWPTNPGDTCTDGAVTWTCRDAASCQSFQDMAFRYSDPTQSLSAPDFVRMLRFIRLWKKLGWTIQQTDAAACSLYRADMALLHSDDVDTLAKQDTGFVTLLPRLGVLLRAMKALNVTVKRDLLSLLACWTDIGVSDGGQWVSDSEGGLQLRVIPSVYRQMFLNPAVMSEDKDTFTDNGYGEFLTGAAKLADHVEALRSSFNLTADELYRIAESLGFKMLLEVPYAHPQPTLEQAILDAAPGIGYDDLKKQLLYAGSLSDTTQAALNAVAVSQEFKTAVGALAAANPSLTALTVPNISAIFRRGWLAHRLKISVRELLLLVQLTGLDPFASPEPTAPALMRLIWLVQAMKDRSLRSAAALYLIWNQDLSGKSLPPASQIAELARTLRDDFASIDDQFTAIEDPNGDVARTRVTLVYGQETSDVFSGLLDGTTVVDVVYIDAAATLATAITQADPAIAYDNFRHRLSHRGIITAKQQADLNGVGGVSEDFKNAVTDLFARGQEIEGLFLTAHPDLQAPYDAALKAAPDLAAADALALRHSAFLKAFDPELARRRKRQQAVQRLSATTGVDPAFAKAMLDAPAKHSPLHAGGDTDRPALDDVIALETAGLQAQFFFRDTATGAVNQTLATAANLDYASGGANPFPNPGNAISGIWSGQIETPEAGYYNLIVEADSDAAVTIKLDGNKLNLTRTQNSDVWRNADAIELIAHTLHDIELTVEKAKDTMRFQWETPKRPREVVPARYLYPPSILDPFTTVYVRFLKAASLAAGLGLTAGELGYFATSTDYQIDADGWLNALTVSGNPQPDTAQALLEPFAALLEFARIKADISPTDESLLKVLKDPKTATHDSESLLFNMTRWDRASLNNVLSWFGSNDVENLAHFDRFRRVYDALALAQRMGISAAALTAAVTNEPSPDMVRNIQLALRARYDAASWRDVVRPINDEMRSLQRDALVAYILHQMHADPDRAHIDTPDKLFEFFLMDVQMEPVMQTSRIRHALSSVQLFVERCLMNLEEPRVSPEAINADQWAWMKRYRVWEANRKVYLFPENWAEPELRDDQSPFFKEAMSELLQGDITEDRAATALLNYLDKLDEVAKLEPCGIYYIPEDQGKRTGETAHVIARTAGGSRKYFYRRREFCSWTPWEQVRLDIEDNPIIPVVWKSRLFMFWLRIIKAPMDQAPAGAAHPRYGQAGGLAPPQGNDPTGPQTLAGASLSQIKTAVQNTAPTEMKVQAMLCWSEFCNGKWQATRTSDVNSPLDLGVWSPTNFDRSTLKLGSSETPDDQLMITVIISDRPSVSFLLFNTHSRPQPSLESNQGYDRTFEPAAPPAFKINYSGVDNFTRDVLKDAMDMRVVAPNHILDHPWDWDAPFFFEDRRNVFFVATRYEPVFVWNSKSYGVAVKHGLSQRASIPPLVVQPMPAPAPKRFWGDGVLVGLNLGAVNPAQIMRFVTQDAYIRQGIATSAVVPYDDRQIGPSGAIPKNIDAGA
jgi:hypothetical protein